MDEEELTSPRQEAIEDALARNYGEFQLLTMEWSREWQRAMSRRAVARKRARLRAQESDTPADDRDVA